MVLANTSQPKFTFAWDNGIVQMIVTLVLIVVIFGLLFFTFSKVCRRKAPFIILTVDEVLTIEDWLLK